MDKQTTGTYVHRDQNLEHTIMVFLKDRMNYENKKVTRVKLLDLVSRSQFHPKVDDRKLRYAINCLRKDGEPICSTGGRDGGYWIAQSPEELQEYINTEIDTRILDLAQQRRALRLTRINMSRFQGDYQPVLI